MLVLLKPGGLEGTASINPFGVAILPGWLTNLVGPLNVIGSLLIAILGVAAVVTRYRRGSTLERQQLRWLLGAVLVAAIPLGISIVGGGPGWIALSFPGIILIPVAVVDCRHAARSLRDRPAHQPRRVVGRLERAARRGLHRGNARAPGVLGGVTQGETLAVAGSTLVAAALFQPLRRRVQARRPPLQPGPLRRATDLVVRSPVAFATKSTSD